MSTVLDQIIGAMSPLAPAAQLPAPETRMLPGA